MRYVERGGGEVGEDGNFAGRLAVYRSIPLGVAVVVRDECHK